MGALTRKQIVTRGLFEAGCPSTLETRINERLNAWLRSQYAALDWPYLTKKATEVPYNTGDTSVNFGVSTGTGSPATGVRRVIDPILIYRSDYSVRGRMRVSTVFNGSLTDDLTVNDPSKHKGIPTTCKVRPHASVQDAFTIFPNVAADRDLLLAIDYVEIPDSIDETSAGDSTRPVYPNDRTLIEAVKYLALELERKVADARAVLEVVGGMVGDDKLKYGALPGINQTWGLDPKIFR